MFFQAYFSELFGIRPGWQLQRNCAILLLKLKPKQIDEELKVDNRIGLVMHEIFD